MGRQLHVHVVDSDCTRRAAIARELYSRLIHVEIYEDLDELIARAPSTGTVLVHADEPSLDEMQLIETIRERAGYLPVAFYSEAPSPDKVVNAMLSGAIGYMQWPAGADALKGSVLRVASLADERIRLEKRKSAARQCVEALTRRERDVLTRVVEGDSNKEIAMHLGISPRTVEIHRANLMTKLDVRSLSEALRLAFAAQGE